MHLTRRHLMSLAALGALSPVVGRAATPRVVDWEDLIPPGVPYSEIIGEGQIDALRDVWLPEFDENATKLNAELDGALIKLFGFMLPIDLTAAGVTSFIMVPYVGACLHVPPPPANQLVFVESDTPWRTNHLWDAVWVTGTMTHELQSTTIADIGYAMTADKIEPYE